MDDKKVLTEVKEMTEDAFKEFVKTLFGEMSTDLKKEIVNELKSEMVPDKKELTEGEKLEKAADFLRALDACKRGDHSKMANFVDEKAVTSETSSLGYSVPTELASKILEKKDKLAKMRKLAFVFQMAGPFDLPKEGTGVTSYWVTENEEITESNPTITKASLDDYYLATRVLMPRKLLNTSAFNIVEYISNLSARSIRNAEETSFVRGSGSGQPTGFRAMTGHNIENQDGAALDYDDLVDAFYGLKEQYRDNAIWMTSAMGMKAIRKIKDEQNLPIFQMSDRTIFGRPVIESEDIPANLQTSADSTEIWLLDPSYYWVKDGDKMFMDTDKIIGKLQLELVVAEAIDGVYTNAEAALQIQAVK
jgi:HK97 family phage major capsid protein